MHCREVAVADVDLELLARWQALARRTPTPNPFLGPEFIRPAARHLPELRGLHLLVVDDENEPVSIMPFYRSWSRGALPVPPGVRACWDRLPFGEPLIAPGYEEAVADSVLEFLISLRFVFWLRLQKLDADGAFARSLIAGVRRGGLPATIDRWDRGLVTRRPEPTYLTEQTHSNLKRLARQRRAFERATGQPMVVVDKASDPRAVEQFLALEAAGWKGRAGVAFLSRPGHADFLRGVCEGFRQRGELRLWSLMSGDQTLALKLNLMDRDHVFCYLIAFDEASGRVSPGLQLEIENFALFHEDAARRVMDSCASSTNTFANRLYPERRHMVDINIGSGLVGRATVSLVPAARRMARRAKRSRSPGPSDD
jgi:CelD/BcsL family acetyltransferase involved in cellulose biosynthesis